MFLKFLETKIENTQLDLFINISHLKHHFVGSTLLALFESGYLLFGNFFFALRIWFSNLSPAIVALSLRIRWRRFHRWRWWRATWFFHFNFAWMWLPHSCSVEKLISILVEIVYLYFGSFLGNSLFDHFGIWVFWNQLIRVYLLLNLKIKFVSRIIEALIV